MFAGAELFPCSPGESPTLAPTLTGDGPPRPLWVMPGWDQGRRLWRHHLSPLIRSPRRWSGLVRSVWPCECTARNRPGPFRALYLVWSFTRLKALLRGHTRSPSLGRRPRRQLSDIGSRCDRYNPFIWRSSAVDRSKIKSIYSFERGKNYYPGLATLIVKSARKFGNIDLKRFAWVRVGN
jgi:hypothetical protein